MNDETKANLIQQLALTTGALATTADRFSKSRYNAETGTLYCNGVVITRSTIEEAKSYFEKMVSQCNAAGAREMRDIGTYYQLAIEAINMMQEGREKDGQA
ncbi:MAG: hypothetical protein K6F99_02095 [Lachnospiraceae bacterium]|nr:hypothetical protein [Lachnospiraceae bacterium]